MSQNALNYYALLPTYSDMRLFPLVCFDRFNRFLIHHICMYYIRQRHFSLCGLSAVSESSSVPWKELFSSTGQ